MAQSRIALRASAARQGEDIRAAQCDALFPVTAPARTKPPRRGEGPSPSLGANVNHSLRGEQSRALSFPLRNAHGFLSLGERSKVKGKGSDLPIGHRIIPGTVELDDSSAGTGGLLNEYEHSVQARA